MSKARRRARPGTASRPAPPRAAGGLRQLGRSDPRLRESAGDRARRAPAELVRRPQSRLLPRALRSLSPRVARGRPPAVAVPSRQRAPARRQRARGGPPRGRAGPAGARRLARGGALGAAPGARRVGRLDHRAEERPLHLLLAGLAAPLSPVAARRRSPGPAPLCRLAPALRPLAAQQRGGDDATRG